MITDSPEAGRPFWLYLLGAVTFVLITIYIIIDINQPESDIYMVDINSVYVNVDGIYVETENGVFKYPKHGVALYESDNGQDYVLRSESEEYTDKLFLTEYTRNELEGK